LKIVFQPELLSGRASSWLREPDNLRTFVSSKRELTNSKVEAARKLLASGTRPREVAGHPKLKNDLRRSSMEEIGSRATIFELEGLGSEKRKYLKWLLAQSVAPKTKIESVMTDDAVAMLSEKLSTPLQFEYYLTRALQGRPETGRRGYDRKCARQGY
jgi:type II secretory pathway predicted ATPase ExeA